MEASDEDGDPLTYRLEGADAGAFGIDAASGQVLTRAGGELRPSRPRRATRCACGLRTAVAARR